MDRGWCRWISLAAGALALAGCPSLFHPQASATPGTEADVASYDALAAQLDAHKSPFLSSSYGNLHPVGNQLFYYDVASGENPDLYRYDDTTGQTLHYGFRTGALGTDDNYVASSQLVVTAEDHTGVFHAYDASLPDSQIDTLQMPDDATAKWWPYAVDGNTVYLVEDLPGNTQLLKWIPGSSATASVVTTLESAGASIGEFWDFGVSGNQMVFIESGRIWQLDLTGNKATWLHNSTEVSSSGNIDVEPDAVTFTTGGSTDGHLFFFDLAKGALTDLGARIASNPYRINATFADDAQFVKGTDRAFARYKSYVVYTGQTPGGIWAYDTAKDTVTPILLTADTATGSVSYSEPVVLADGKLFVTATGADGAPKDASGIVQVNLAKVLP